MTAIKLPYGIYYYDPTQPLGRRGGFGQVFAGSTSQEEPVAVKKLHLSAVDAAHRELRIAEELRGRSFGHVVGFLDAGEDAESGALFVIMPRAEKSLQKLIETEGPLDAVMASRTMLEISKGLVEVGDLVHRDLKPDNILLHNSAWKIADFGIARFIAEATSNDTLREFMSDGYAAPEQWRSERATHATDVYALRCIGFWVLLELPGGFSLDGLKGAERRQSF
jgi:eukaryotic-like serine/threonine-protein kinase